MAGAPINLLMCGQVKLGELEAELVEMNGNSEKLERSYNELLEYKLVMQKVCTVLAIKPIPTNCLAMCFTAINCVFHL